MSRIYKTFEKWYMTQDMSRGFYLTDIWDARQPEIDQLKARINSLEAVIKRVADDMDSTFISPTAVAIVSELRGILKETSK